MVIYLWWHVGLFRNQGLQKFSMTSDEMSATFWIIFTLYITQFLKAFESVDNRHMKKKVSWSPSKENNIKVNVDGSSIGNPGRSGLKGLIRNMHGEWLRLYLDELFYKHFNMYFLTNNFSISTLTCYIIFWISDKSLTKD